MENADQFLDPDRMAVYRDLQRSIPKLGEMYRLVRRIVDRNAPQGGRILLVGAGGGREIAALSETRNALKIVAVDPSRKNLLHARQVAKVVGLTERIAFHIGTTGSLGPTDPFHVATSLLVMHHIPDDGEKLAYLSAIRERLFSGGVLIHADICFDESDDRHQLLTEYLSYARSEGVCQEAMDIEVDAISRLPIVSGPRTRALFAEAGFEESREAFRSLWYRCWIAGKDLSQSVP